MPLEMRLADGRTISVERDLDAVCEDCWNGGVTSTNQFLLPDGGQLCADHLVERYNWSAEVDTSTPVVVS